jgi:hypothetical protein
MTVFPTSAKPTWGCLDIEDGVSEAAALPLPDAGADDADRWARALLETASDSPRRKA